MPDVNLQKELVSKLSGFRDTIPVFRIRERLVEELEKEASSIATAQFTQTGQEAPRFNVTRKEGVSLIQLPEDITATVFHRSGAIMTTRRTPPMDRVFKEKVEKDRLIEKATQAAQRMGLGRHETSTDRLQFERLWQIKANGITKDGKRGQEVLCRAVGALRRSLHGIPILGRASAFVKLDGALQVEAMGLDWRPVQGDPVEMAKIIQPSDAANTILGELAARMSGTSPTLKTHVPAMFSLGYFSMPKQRAQTVFQPVYVAMLHAQGDTTLNHLIIVPASPTQYEPIGRIVAEPRQQATKPAIAPRTSPVVNG